jgi:dihydroorotase-like cyclic amidohydrolase
VREALAAYRASAEGRCFVDYAFHAIITDPSLQVLNQELPALVRQGYTSYKLYMTYRGLQLTDRRSSTSCARCAASRRWRWSTPRTPNSSSG